MDQTEWSPPTWQRETPDEVAKYIWCPGCAVPATAGRPGMTRSHICGKKATEEES